MKRKFQLLALGALTALSAAAAEPTDTIIYIDKPSVVNITDGNGSRKIVVRGREGEPGFKFEYNGSIDDDMEVTGLEHLLSLGTRLTGGFSGAPRRQRAFSVHVGCDFYAGAHIPLSGDDGLSKTGWQIGMLNVAKLQWRLSGSGTALSLGIGWQYSYLNIGDGLMGTRTADGAYLLQPIPAEYSKVKTSLRNFAVQFPLLLSQRLSGRFTFEAGGVMMLNTYTTGNRSWTDGDVNSKLQLKNLHQRLLTVDVMARLGWRGRFAVYVRYSPMQLFSTAYGPQFNPISVGGSLGF